MDRRRGMEILKRLEWNKKTASAFTVSAALTIILVVTLAPQEIRIAENTTLKPVEWTFQRPSQTTTIDYTLESPYSHGGLQATFHTLLGKYIEGVSDEDDYLTVKLRINATVNNADGFIKTIRWIAYKDQKSLIAWIQPVLKLENLSLTSILDGYQRNTQAYIKLAGVNHTSSVRVEAPAEWIFLTSNTQSHTLEVACEVIYYNGTAYNKVVQPFQLNIVGGEGA